MLFFFFFFLGALNISNIRIVVCTLVCTKPIDKSWLQDKTKFDLLSSCYLHEILHILLLFCMYVNNNKNKCCCRFDYSFAHLNLLSVSNIQNWIRWLLNIIHVRACEFYMVPYFIVVVFFVVHSSHKHFRIHIHIYRARMKSYMYKSAKENNIKGKTTSITTTTTSAKPCEQLIK